MKPLRRKPLHLQIRRWPSAIRIVLAVLCLLVGLSGLILPILPGWPFLFVGLAILTTVSPALERFWRARMRRHPGLRKVLRKVQTKKPAANSSPNP